MRILLISQRVPYPPDKGDKIATYNQIRYLSQRHAVSVACLAESPAELLHVEPLKAMTVSIDAVLLRRQAARSRALASLFSGSPITTAYLNEAELHRKIASRMPDRCFDAILVYGSGVAQFAEPYPGLPRVINFADLDSLKWKDYARNARFPASWIYAREHRLLLQYERHLAETWNHSIVCTTAELEDFRRLIAGPPVTCVSNGVDLEYFKPGGAQKKPHSMVFTGVMDYLPNIDGITWFCSEVFPLIRSRIPDASLTICGSRPTNKVQALSCVDGVQVTGRVPDVRPYLDSSAICVVPLRLARGIQNKVLEAMAMGLPTVSCTASFKGVEAVPGRDLEVVDDPSEFAATVVRLLQSEELRRRMGQAARTQMENCYDWGRQLSRLDEILTSVAGVHCDPAPR